MPYKDPEKQKQSKRKYQLKNRELLRQRHKIYNDNNKDRAYEYDLIRVYGVTLDQYNTILEAQGGVCAICGGVNKSGQRLCMDHDHKTNLPRGILCRRCNTLLGLCDDNIGILINMIDYLRRYNG